MFFGTSLQIHLLSESEISFLHSLFWWDENFLLLIDEAKGQGASVAEGLQKHVFNPFWFSTLYDPVSFSASLYIGGNTHCSVVVSVMMV